VPNLSENLLSISQLTQTCSIVESFLDRFYVFNLKKGNSIIIGGILYPMKSLYKLCESNRPEPELTALVSHNDERSQIWHERLRHLNFLSLQELET
jgi:hypothetical protein